MKSVNGQTICLCFCLVRLLLIWPRFRTPKWRMVINHESELIWRELVRVYRNFSIQKATAVPITGVCMPWGFQEVEAPRFQDSRHM
jgi:hypothetical protein